jgi:excisionase family DNA binding protein
MERLLLTIPEAAQIMGLTEVAVRELVRSGQLPVIRQSPRRTRIPLPGLARFLGIPIAEALHTLRA